MVLPNLVFHVNPKHLVYITADHLKTLKSPNEKNGTYSHRFQNYNKFFFIIGIFILNWLSCRIDPHNITNPSQRYPVITLTDFYKSTKIKCEKFHAEKKK